MGSLVLIFRTTGLLNFAQGEMALFATFMCWQLYDLGVPIGYTLVGAMIASFFMGSIVHPG